MNLNLPPHMSEPKWNELETRLTEKIGKKLFTKVGFTMRRTVVSLKTYFHEVFNPIVTRDFKEKTSVVFQEGRIQKGKRNKK
jgi:hypothetical protein